MSRHKITIEIEVNDEEFLAKHRRFDLLEEKASDALRWIDGVDSVSVQQVLVFEGFDKR